MTSGIIYCDFQNPIFSSDEYKIFQFRKTPIIRTSVGFHFTNRLKKRWLLQYGIQYQMSYFRNTVQVGAGLEFDVTNTVRLGYGKMPILLQYNWVDKSQIRIFSSAGIQPGILIREEGGYTVWGLNSNGEIYTLQTIPVPGIYKNFSLDICGTLGWQIKLWKTLHFYQSLKFDYSILNIENRNYRYEMYRKASNNTQKELFLVFEENRPATRIMAISYNILGFTFILPSK